MAADGDKTARSDFIIIAGRFSILWLLSPESG